MERFGALEADFLAHYQIHLYRSLKSISWRRFMVLFEGLPADGAFWRSIQSDRETQTQRVQQRDETRAAQRKRLGLGPAPTFPHRRSA